MLRLFSIIFPPFFIIFLFALPSMIHILKVDGMSMSPTLNTGDLIVVDMISLKFISPRRGEILLFDNPHWAVNPIGRSQIDIKRVIGLPGETVHIQPDKIIITKACTPDGTPLAFARSEVTEVSSPCQQIFATSTLIGGGTANGNNNSFDMFLGPDDFFVLGDNRMGSIDSRNFGAVQPSNFKARKLFSISI